MNEPLVPHIPQFPRWDTRNRTPHVLSKYIFFCVFKVPLFTYIVHRNVGITQNHNEKISKQLHG